MGHFTTDIKKLAKEHVEYCYFDCTKMSDAKKEEFWQTCLSNDLDYKYSTEDYIKAGFIKGGVMFVDPEGYLTHDRLDAVEEGELDISEFYVSDSEKLNHSIEQYIESRFTELPPHIKIDRNLNISLSCADIELQLNEIKSVLDDAMGKFDIQFKEMRIIL